MLGLVRRALTLGPLGLPDLMWLAVLAIVAELGIRTRPLPQVAGWFGVRLIGEPATATQWRMKPRHRRRRRIIGMFSRHWPFVDRSGLCLRRSLLLGWTFRELDPLLRIGVARVDGQFVAHAWLEVAGGHIGADSKYNPLFFGARGVSSITGADTDDPVKSD